MKKILLISIITILIIPQITFASWWNPFSWKIFNKSSEVKKEKPITPPVNPIDISIQTTQELEKIKLETELEQAKAEATKAEADAEKAQKEAGVARKKLAKENLRKQQEEQAKQQIQNSQPIAVETWEKQEARDFAYADTKGWTSITSTNALGEKRYYRKEGNQWVRKNSEAEAQVQYSPALSQFNACVKQTIEEHKKRLAQAKIDQEQCPPAGSLGSIACSIRYSPVQAVLHLITNQHTLQYLQLTHPQRQQDHQHSIHFVVIWKKLSKKDA